MQVFTIGATITAPRFDESVPAFVDTDGRVFRDRDVAQMTADLMTIANDDVGLVSHGTEEVVSFHVVELMIN